MAIGTGCTVSAVAESTMLSSLHPFPRIQREYPGTCHASLRQRETPGTCSFRENLSVSTVVSGRSRGT